MVLSPADAEYVKSVEFMRREKDYFFREDPQSPIPHELRVSFRGLEYFPVEPRYRMRVPLQRYPTPEPIVLATSKGVPRQMVRFGYFDVDIDGVAQRLHAYRAVPAAGHAHADTGLFVPFRDGTSGKESYGAARYLDLEEDSPGQYAIDFNLAYNPYCAYSDDYICPFPPRENWLSAPIRAGEKAFPQVH